MRLVTAIVPVLACFVLSNEGSATGLCTCACLATPDKRLNQLVVLHSVRYKLEFISRLYFLISCHQQGWHSVRWNRAAV